MVHGTLPGPNLHQWFHGFFNTKVLNLHLVDGSSEVLLQFAVIQRPQRGIDVGRDGVIQLHLRSPEDRDQNGRIWDSNGPEVG